MTSLPRYLIAIALLVFSAGFRDVTQSQTPAAKKGSVSGTVTIKGKPAARVVVALRSSDFASFNESVFKAITDQEGKYRIGNVPAGSYRAFISASTYVNSFNSSSMAGVVVSEGENVEGIDFSLVLGGAVTGKVTDAEGQPVIEQRVNLLGTNSVPNQQANVFVYSGVQTDDRGIYRMFGVAAGRYRVAVGGGDEAFFNPGSGRPLFKQSFYTQAEDASDAAKATEIEVTEGGETSHIDITVGRTTKTFAVSGRLVDGENGQPVAGARFGMQHILGERRAAYIGVNAVSNSKGEFTVENLPPGNYALFLANQPNTDLRSEAVSFEIVDQDVNGLLVKTTKETGSVAGNIVLDNTEDKAVFAQLSQLRIQAFNQRTGASLNANLSHSANINADGSFRLNGLEPGLLYLSLGSMDPGLMKRFVISRVERDGIPEPRGITIKSGDQITGVRLVVSYGNCTVRGTVQLDNGALPTGVQVIIRVTKEGNPRPLQSPQVDARGHFMLQGIPSGLYIFESNMFVPGVMSRPQPAVKQAVNVVEGAVTDVTITLSNPKPEPTSP